MTNLRTPAILIMCLVSGLASAQEARKGHTLYGMSADGTNVRELARFEGYPIINSPEVSPDGKWVGVDGWREGENLRDAHLLFVHLETGEVRDLGEGAMPSWSADGKWFAYSSYAPRGVFISSFDGQQQQLIDEEGWGIQWSPDGMKAVYTKSIFDRSQLVVYDFIGRTRQHVFEDDLPYSSIYWNCKWSPDSTQVCIKGRRSGGKEEIAIINIEDREPRIQILCDAAEFLPDIGWHPDGSPITLPDRTGRIQVLDAGGDQKPVLFAGQPTDRHNSGMCWTHDGQTLIFISGT